MKTTELAQTCLQKKKKGNRVKTGEEPFWHLVKWEKNSQKYNCTIQMTKCQRLVHMLTVKKLFCDKLNHYVLTT